MVFQGKPRASMRTMGLAVLMMFFLRDRGSFCSDRCERKWFAKDGDDAGPVKPRPQDAVAPAVQRSAGALRFCSTNGRRQGGPTIPARTKAFKPDSAGSGERDRRDFQEHNDMDQQPLQQSYPDRRHGDGGVPTCTMRTQPLPLMSAAARVPARSRLTRFAVPFLAVFAYYALGVCTFAVMAAGNVPGGGDVRQLAWYATEITSPIALAIALAAGRWWV